MQTTVFLNASDSGGVMGHCVHSELKSLVMLIVHLVLTFIYFSSLFTFH